MKTLGLLLLLHLSLGLQAQSVSKVVKIDELRRLINQQDSTCVINFWATWCKPCVAELPGFDSLAKSRPDVKVLLVCLDFKEDVNTKVNPFLKKKNIQLPCVLLDEVNGNDFVNKISPKWSGAIPATLFKKNATEVLIEKKLSRTQLEETLGSL